MPLSPTPLTAISGFSEAVYPPLGGSKINAADIAHGEQIMLNRTAYLLATQLIAVDVAGILALLNEALIDYAAHRASAVFHAPPDMTNVVSTTACVSLDQAIPRANLLKAGLRAHYLNGGDSYHDVADTVNETALGLVPNATEVQSLRILVIGIKAAYEAHRVAGGVHIADDTTNVITAAEPAVPILHGPIEFAGQPQDVFFTQNDDGDDSLVTVYYTFGAGGGLYQVGPYIDIPRCKVGDILYASFSGNGQGDFTGEGTLRLDFILDYGGPGETVQAHFAGARQRCTPMTGPSRPFPIGLRGYQVVSVAGTGRVMLVGKTTSLALELSSAYTLTVRRYR